ncbi:MAG: arylamine N-acetyltransferase [Planctomycetota bacterium]
MTDPVLERFLEHFQIDPNVAPRELVRRVATMFARLPYENLSKILKSEREENAERARRGAEEVLGDHIALGTGGTCFSLTACLVHLLRALGFEAQPLLADRSYGDNTHCALVVWIEGAPELIDPGFLLTDPTPLGRESETRISHPSHDVILRPREKSIELFTSRHGQEVRRLEIKKRPIDDGEFRDVWDASFDWDMMRYPVVTQFAGDSHLYLQGRSLRRRNATENEQVELGDAELAARIAREFGIDRTLAERALQSIQRREGQL